jgi:hypothetical protein
MALNLLGFTSGAGADVAANTQAVRIEQRPFDFGTGGSYHLCSKSGIMAAGLGAAATIYSFRNNSVNTLVLARRVKLSAWSLGTGFAVGLATFELWKATSWSAPDTGGVTDTITTSNGKLRTTMPSISALSEIRHSSTAALGVGTRTLDAQPEESINTTVTVGANTPFVSFPAYLIDKINAQYPLVLAPSEGFIILATVPATGTWSFAITSEWDETSVYAP